MSLNTRSHANLWFLLLLSATFIFTISFSSVVRSEAKSEPTTASPEVNAQPTIIPEADLDVKEPKLSHPPAARDYLATANRSALKPRKQFSKPSAESRAYQYVQNAIRVKFKDGTLIETLDGRITNLDAIDQLGLRGGVWIQAASQNQERHLEIWKRAEGKTQEETLDIFTLFYYTIPEGEDPWTYIDLFNQLDCVEAATPIEQVAIPGVGLSVREEATTLSHPAGDYPWLYPDRPETNNDNSNINAIGVWETKGITGRAVNFGVVVWGAIPTGASNDLPLITHFGPFFYQATQFDINHFFYSGSKNNGFQFTGTTYNSNFVAASQAAGGVNCGIIPNLCISLAPELAFLSLTGGMPGGGVVLVPYIFAYHNASGVFLFEAPFSANETVAAVVSQMAAADYTVVMAAGNSNTNLSNISIPGVTNSIVACPAILATGGAVHNSFGFPYEQRMDYVATYANALSDVSANVIAGSAALIESGYRNFGLSNPNFPHVTDYLGYFYFTQQRRGRLLDPLDEIHHLRTFLIPPVVRLQTPLPEARIVRVDGTESLNVGGGNPLENVNGVLYLYNDGSQPLTISDAIIETVQAPENAEGCNDSPYPFRWASTPPVSIGPGESTALRFQICATLGGAYRAAVRLLTNDPNLPSGVMRFELTANINAAPAGRLEVKDADGVTIPYTPGGYLYDFGSRRVGEVENIKELVLRNTGQGKLTGWINVAGAPNWTWKLVGSSRPLNFVLDPQERVTLRITYGAPRTGPHEIPMLIWSTDPVVSNFSLRLHGETRPGQEGEVYIMGRDGVQHFNAVQLDLGAVPVNEHWDKWVAQALVLGARTTKHVELVTDNLAGTVYELLTDPPNALVAPISETRRIPLIVRPRNPGDHGRAGPFRTTYYAKESFVERPPLLQVQFIARPYLQLPGGVSFSAVPPGNNLAGLADPANAVSSVPVPIGSSYEMSTAIGVPLTQRFLIKNTRSQTMYLTDFGFEGEGYIVTARFGTIQPGEEIPIDVTLTGAQEGTFKAGIWFFADTNPGSETNPFFTFDVIGTVGRGDGGGGGQSCVTTVNPTSRTHPSSGGTGNFTVNAPDNCNWTTGSSAGWISITSGNSGAGDGTVGYSVSANSGAQRTGTINVGGKTFTIRQDAGGGGGGGEPPAPGEVLIVRGATPESGTPIADGGSVDYFSVAPDLVGLDKYWIINRSNRTLRFEGVSTTHQLGRAFSPVGAGCCDDIAPNEAKRFYIDVKERFSARRFHTTLQVQYSFGSLSTFDQALIHLYHGPTQLVPIPELTLRIEDSSGNRISLGGVNPDWSRIPMEGEFNLGAGTPSISASKEIRIYNDNSEPIYLHDFWIYANPGNQPAHTRDVVHGRLEPGQFISTRIHYHENALGFHRVDLYGSYSRVGVSIENSNGFYIPLKMRIWNSSFAYLSDAAFKAMFTDSVYAGFNAEAGRPFSRNITISNFGPQPLEISVPEVTGNGYSRIGDIMEGRGAEPPAIVQNPTVLRLPPYVPGEPISYLKFRVRLHSNQVGAHNGEITFTTNDPRQQARYRIQGEVVPAGTQNSSVQVHQGADVVLNGGTFASDEPMIFTVSNHGAGSVSLGNLVVPEAYEVVRPLPLSIPAGGNGQFELRKDASAPKGAGAVIAFETSSSGGEVFEMTDNNKPVAVDDVRTTAPGTLVNIDVTANDSDADGDSVALITQPIVTTPNHGTAVRLSDSSITYTPVRGFTGIDSFEYEIGDGNGRRARATVTITVGENSRPVAVDDAASTGLNVAVSISVTANDYDPDGEPVSLINNPIVAAPAHGTAVRISQSTIVYTPAAQFSGTDTFQYEIGDGQGHRARAWVTVTITGTNNKPIAVDDTASTAVDTAVTINVTANDSDPDGDAVSLISNPITVVPSHGTATRVSSSSVVYTPALGYTGSDTFQYEIGDGRGKRARAWVTVTVTNNNHRPVAVDDVVSGEMNAALLINVTANDSDPDGDQVSLISQPIVVGPAHGTAVRISANSISYAPAAGFTGTDSFQYEIGDGRGMRDRATVTVTVIDGNHNPIAVNDLGSTDSATPLAITVTANDYDPDGDAVSLITNPVTVMPLHGTAVKISQNGISYTPAPGYVGSDTFQYEIGDGHGKRARAWVTVTVTNTNNPPVAVDDLAATNLSTAITINVTANDYDPDGDLVTLITSPVITAPRHGTAEKVSQTSIRYTPAAGFVGNDSFEYEIGDGHGRRSRAWVTITVSDPNHAPVAVNDGAATARNVAVTINVTANDSDVDGDPVSLISQPIIVGPTHGAAIRVSSNSITYTPAAGFIGVDTFQYEIGDGRGKRARAWVTVNVY